MHSFILLMIGPFGHNSNMVIWPWNVSFMILLIILFKPKNGFSIKQIFSQKAELKTLLVVLLFGILPLLSFWGWWPKHFSAALYSGNKVRSAVYLSDEIKSKLPANVQAKVNDFDNQLSTTSWTQGELNVAMYPTDRVHFSMFENLCLGYPTEQDFLVLQFFEVPDFWSGERAEKSYFCDDVINTPSHD